MKKEYTKDNIAKKGDKKLNMQELDNVAGGCDILSEEDKKAIQNQQFLDRRACELFSCKDNSIYGKVRICGNCKNEELRVSDGMEVCKLGK